MYNYVLTGNELSSLVYFISGALLYTGAKNVRLKGLYHGGLSQWGRSNRPRIRPGTVKSLNAPRELSSLAPRTGLCQEN